MAEIDATGARVGRGGRGQSACGAGRDAGRTHAYLSLVVLAVALLIARHVARSSMGRVLVALRDNEDAARAFSISAPLRKLQAYAVAGALAGLGGAMFAFTQTVVSAGTFPAYTSLILSLLLFLSSAGLVPRPILRPSLSYPTLVLFTSAPSLPLPFALPLAFPISSFTAKTVLLAGKDLHIVVASFSFSSFA